MTDVKCEVQNGIGLVTLCAPERKNAISTSTAIALRTVVEQLDGDESVSVVVLAADGPDFCAGADLRELQRTLNASYSGHLESAGHLAQAFLAFVDCSKPSIAVVRGRALAGGFALAMSCDMIVAGETAEFGFPEITFGFVPAMAVALLARSVGEPRAMELALTGRRIPVREAEALGIVNRVLPDAELDAAGLDLAHSLASKPLHALRATRAMVRVAMEVPLRDAIARGAIVNAEARSSDALRSGISAHLARLAQRTEPRGE